MSPVRNRLDWQCSVVTHLRYFGMLGRDLTPAEMVALDQAYADGDKAEQAALVIVDARTAQADGQRAVTV